jgi:hypothetical protein
LAGIVSSLSGFIQLTKTDPFVTEVLLTLTFVITGIPETRDEEISFEALLSVPLGKTATIL